MSLAIRNSLLVSVLLSLLAGCGGGQFGGQSAGNVAVIDMDKVAAATGIDKRISASVQQYVAAQEAALTKLRDETRARLDKQKKQLPANASDDDKRNFAERAQASGRDVYQETGKIQQGAAQMRRRLRLAFRGEVEPVAKKIAAQRGMDIVMVKHSALLSVDAKADITDAVVVAMLQSDKQQAPAK